MRPYTFHITLYDAAFFGTLFIGFTFILLLWFTGKANKAANRFLAMALIVAVLWIARILAIDIQLAAYVPFWSRLPLQFSLALGPLIYFYVLKITRPEYQFRRKDLLHFSPLILELAVQLFVKQLSPAVQLLAFISFAIYLYRCRKLIESFYQQQKFTGGDRYRHELQWLNRLLIGFGILWLLWIPCIAMGYSFHLGARAYFPLYLLLMLMLIWIAARAFLRPEVSAQAESAPVLKPLLPAELKQKAIWLKRVVKENHYYQDPELSLSSLAEKLELTTHELSRILNTVLKKSFNDFINEYRVQDAARKMQDPAFDHITLLGIAYESGFNSQSTFNRIFKQITGKSPVEYKKEQSTYNLGSQPRSAQVISHHETTPKWFLEKLTRNDMFKNYFKIARRNLVRNKSYTAINVTGLAVGIAVCMVIFIIIQFQTSYDTFHAKKDRVYRVLTEYHHADVAGVFYGRELPFPMPVGLKTAFPQLEQVAAVYASHDDQLLIPGSNGTNVAEFKEQRGVFFTEPSFFKMFDFPLLAGSYESLKDPNNVLLTKETAEKYFGDWKAAMGKTIKLQAGGFMFEHGTEVLKVSGILATMPANTDFHFKMVVAYGTGFTGSLMARSTDWNVTAPDFGCYVLLPQNVSVANFNQQLRAYSRKVKPAANKDSHIIQPLSAVHYDTQA
ncbi:MAG TPA: ABC transporter permease, partial [Mucilaginibacter sp.]|nr:ABC transporter permease [Mucilaginibacter sp.]